VIGPWNYPLINNFGDAIPALVAGNSVVLKPSRWGSLTPLRLAELCAEAELPPGVVNVVCGGPASGQALVEHPGVDAISFTGSTSTGSGVMAAAASRVKHVHLELGGKSPNIVFADADLDRAARVLPANRWAAADYEHYGLKAAITWLPTLSRRTNLSRYFSTRAWKPGSSGTRKTGCGASEPPMPADC